MAYPVVEATATTPYSANQTSHAVNLPSGIQAGDCLVMWFCRDSTTGTITQPSGWTLDHTVTQSDQSIVCTKTADGTESGTVTVATSASESSTAIVMRISGHTAKQSAGLAVSASSLFANPPTITPASAVDALLICFGSGIGGATVNLVQNGSTTALFEAGNAADTNNTVCAYAIWANLIVDPAVNVNTINWAWQAAAVHRLATVLISGTASGGGVRFNPGFNGGLNG